MNRESRAGTKVPPVELAELRDGKVERVRSAELFDHRKVFLFSSPGVFTPTGSTAHVPGFVAKLKDFQSAGIDDIV